MPEQTYQDTQPRVPWLDAVFRHRTSLGDAGIRVLERQERIGRPVRIIGAQHIPAEGPLILASNHFVRMTDPGHALGPHKMEDLLSSLGAITRVVRNRRGPDATVIWTPTSLPRPEAVLKKKATPEEILTWLADKGPSMGVSNASRTLFLWMYRNAPDVIPVPSDKRKLAAFFEAIRSRLGYGDVLGIFPEGEVSRELRPAQPGVARIATESRAPVVPVSQFDQNGELTVRFGMPMEPPAGRTGRIAFAEGVMNAIASGLPEQLQGAYRQPSANGT